jgi:hypothetical protein
MSENDNENQSQRQKASLELTRITIKKIAALEKKKKD